MPGLCVVVHPSGRSRRAASGCSPSEMLSPTIQYCLGGGAPAARTPHSVPGAQASSRYPSARLGAPLSAIRVPTGTASLSPFGSEPDGVSARLRKLRLW